ncbi:ATP-dependent DNA helicase [Flaviflexus salsibiostraticola]|uniref:DNA 3'-5' helicase n=1 Tax=Flaviflexus salsibiostraticola TaxID=1282737 RepID=A0A3Q8WTD7_9ACTO|nr:ATP-dependent DNA helicase UvrD2 [Flaviflexus salsibiostraticola]AZN29879.1 ATP-dependent DNA helicase [Flaviflexus salsibiostraticola]
MDVEQLLSALDPDQRTVAEHLRGPLVVRAGAGTGKTRAITYRIAHGVLVGAYEPTNVLAVTFTARAAGEMRSRLRDLGAHGVQAQTFHAAALRQLSYFWAHAVGGPMPQLQEHKAGLVAQAAGQLGMSVDRTTIRDLASEIEWSKVSLAGPEHYVERAQSAAREPVSGMSHEAIQRLILAYEEAKSARGVIDFEDIILILIGIMSERDDIARQIRHQYRHFVVDEYQDVSPLQQRLLDHWLGERTDLCVVGDVSQTIYSFTGATPRYLRDFRKRFKDAAEIELVRDYRSTPQVVDVANRVIAPGRLAGSVKLVAQRPSGPSVSFRDYDDDDAEAKDVAARILALQDRDVLLSEIAILIRTNAQSQAFESALSAVGIGFTIRGGERYFSRKEVREAMVMMRTLARSGVDATMPDAVREVVGRLGWSSDAPKSAGAQRERWEALNALVTLADDIDKARGADLSGFVSELEERASTQNAPTIEGVTISTMHAAKGLEWDAVFLVGMSEGLMPISLAETPAAVDEERRLLYVGVTRAREHLHLSYARSRSAAGRGNRRRTRFLDGIWPEEENVSRATKNRRRSKEAAVDFELNHPQDVALLNDLKAWRRIQAEEERRPAYMILVDSVLMSIAAAKPATIAELGRVKGIGMTKLDRYGAAILAVVDGHA